MALPHPKMLELKHVVISLVHFRNEFVWVQYSAKNELSSAVRVRVRTYNLLLIWFIWGKGNLCVE